MFHDQPRDMHFMVRGYQSPWAARFLMALGLAFTMGTSIAAQHTHPKFTDIVEKASPAVVNISTTQSVKTSQGFPHGEMPQMPEGTPFDEFLRRFFGDRGGPGGRGGPGDDGDEGGDGGNMEEFDSRSLGSGFVISADGYILTFFLVFLVVLVFVVRLCFRRAVSFSL